MGESGRVLVIERVVPAVGEVADGFTVWDTTAIDLTILAIEGGGGGRVRTAEEFKAVLAAGGFTLTAIIPTASSVRVIEARPTST